jgi:hypothetical protein
MYHCVPRIISGLSQMLGLSLSTTMAETTIGNRRFAGKAARNCATGCTRLAARGRVPTQTPTGTQMQLAMAISTTTRHKVTMPSRNVVPTSPRLTPVVAKRTTCQSATAPSARMTPFQTRGAQPPSSRAACLYAPPRSNQRARIDRAHSMANGAVRRSTSRERRRTSSIHERGGRSPASCSKRKRSAHATSGRNSTWS